MGIDMKKELPLGVSPIICYPNYADIFSILDAYSKDYKVWIYNYFIQLTVPDNHILGHRLDFSTPRLLESLPWLNAERLERQFSVDLCGGSYTDFIISAIKHGKYVFTLLDTYYNKSYPSFGKEHFLHEHLIYGYDEESREFLFADNIHNGKYGYGYVDFDAVEKANLSIAQREMTDWYDGTYLLSYRRSYDYGMCTFRNYYRHPFSFSLALGLAEDYLTEKPTEKRWTLPNSLVGQDVETSEKCWGLGIYRYLTEYLQLIAEGKYIEMRTFYTLYEHKKILKDILVYIYCSANQSLPSDIQRRCDDSIKASNIINSLIIKYSITNKKNQLEAIKDKLKVLYENDIFIMKNMQCILKEILHELF